MSNVQEIITNRMIELLEKDTAPWQKPWLSKAPVNLISQKAYRGLNVISLASQGYASEYWLTFNQANKLGGKIRKGEHGSLVVFWSIGDEKLNAKTGKLSKPVLLRYSTAFNLTQTEGIAEKLGLDKQVPRVPDIEAAEKIVASMPNPPKFEASNKAWYSSTRDVVGLPARESFVSPEAFASVRFHELGHSSGHASRLNRFEGENCDHNFGSESYSKEELVAELTAAMLCGTCGISPTVIENSAAYCQSWIARLKGDSRLIVSAASAAQKASDYIQGITPKSAGNASEESASEAAA
jgi:antirestriction protein ArdC